jgi:hypothetical protein
VKATDDRNVFKRGKGGVYYVRRRIPKPLLTAYPQGKTEIVRSLGTADPRTARSKAILELAAIEREFAAKRAEIDVSRASEHPLSVRSLTDEQLAGIGDFYSRQVLLADERRREAGLDDEDFEELGSQLQAQRAELAGMLAQGGTAPILPALRSFLHLCGLRFNPEPDEAAHAAGTFLRAVVRTLDEQLSRHRGDPVEAPAEAPGTHPLYMVAPHLSPSATAKSSWSEVFNARYRSPGQSGEASYWIPALMYYTGGRPEEFAGLAFDDLRKDPARGWYLDIVDRPCAEDRDLFYPFVHFPR